jgi:hypothetical protein
MRLSDPGRPGGAHGGVGPVTAALLGALTGLEAVLLVLVLPAIAFAASPDPTAVAAGDPRSSGQGPGLVGDPLAAILVVGAIAALAITATLLYVRATGGPSAGRSRR